MTRPSPAPPFEQASALLKYAGRSARTENALATLLGLIQAVLTIALAWQVASMLAQAVYPASLSKSQLPDAQAWLTLAAIMVGRVLSGYSQKRIANRASIKIRQRLRQLALTACFELNIRLFPHFRVAEISNVLATEIDKQRGYFADFVSQKNLALFMPLAIIIATAQVSWLVPLIFLLTAPLVPVFMMLVGFKAADASRANLQQLNRLGDLLADRLKNLTALQLARRCDAEAGQLFSQSEQYRHSTMSVLRLSFLSGTVLEFFSAISVAIVAVYLGLFFLGKYDIGSYDGYGLFAGVFILMLAPEFYLPLRRMGALYHERADAISLAEQLIRLQQLAAQQPVTQSAGHSSIPALQQLSIGQLVSGDGHGVHQPVSFSLQAGDRLLLDGPSGSGKTTLLDTLAGLRPAMAGSIFINQQPCSVLLHPDWLAQLGYLSQQPELLFASIRDNLCLGRNFSDDQLYQALASARAEQLVLQLPGQLDYHISDRGGYLSGGQAQRIALARVFLHRPALLLLDEPSANLDQQTASEFMQQLRHYSDAGGIIIMASHRPAERDFFNHRLQLQRATTEQQGAA